MASRFSFRRDSSSEGVSGTEADEVAGFELGESVEAVTKRVSEDIFEISIFFPDCGEGVIGRPNFRSVLLAIQREDTEYGSTP